MDEYLEAMDCAALTAGIRKLRGAIRIHRDATGHDLCWHHPDMGPLAGTNKTVHCGAALAEIHARLHPPPGVPRRAGARRSHPRQGI